MCVLGTNSRKLTVLSACIFSFPSPVDWSTHLDAYLSPSPALQPHLSGDIEALWGVDLCPQLSSQSRCSTVWWQRWGGVSKKEQIPTHRYLCLVLTQIPKRKTQRHSDWFQLVALEVSISLLWCRGGGGPGQLTSCQTGSRERRQGITLSMYPRCLLSPVRPYLLFLPPLNDTAQGQSVH